MATEQITIPVLQMPWSDPSDLASFPDAVWRPALTNLDGMAFQAGVEMYACVNLADLEAGAAPIPGAQHHVDVTTSQFLATGAAAPVGTTNLAVFAAVILAMAQSDPFFATATIVQATVTVSIP